jgi:hypothetical protein
MIEPEEAWRCKIIRVLANPEIVRKNIRIRKAK